MLGIIVILGLYGAGFASGYGLRHYQSWQRHKQMRP